MDTCTPQHTPPLISATYEHGNVKIGQDVYTRRLEHSQESVLIVETRAELPTREGITDIQQRLHEISVVRDAVLYAFQETEKELKQIHPLVQNYKEQGPPSSLPLPPAPAPWYPPVDGQMPPSLEELASPVSQTPQTGPGGRRQWPPRGGQDSGGSGWRPNWAGGPTNDDVWSEWNNCPTGPAAKPAHWRPDWAGGPTYESFRPPWSGYDGPTRPQPGADVEPPSDIDLEGAPRWTSRTPVVEPIVKRRYIAPLCGPAGCVERQPVEEPIVKRRYIAPLCGPAGCFERQPVHEPIDKRPYLAPLSGTADCFERRPVEEPIVKWPFFTPLSGTADCSERQTDEEPIQKWPFFTPLSGTADCFERQPVEEPIAKRRHLAHPGANASTARLKYKAPKPTKFLPPSTKPPWRPGGTIGSSQSVLGQPQTQFLDSGRSATTCRAPQRTASAQPTRITRQPSSSTRPRPASSSTYPQPTKAGGPQSWRFGESSGRSTTVAADRPSHQIENLIATFDGIEESAVGEIKKSGGQHTALNHSVAALKGEGTSRGSG